MKKFNFFLIALLLISVSIYAQVEVAVTHTTAGSMATELDAALSTAAITDATTVTKLTVTGSAFLNLTDCRYIRTKLNGAKTNTATGILTLDLSGAAFEKDSIPKAGSAANGAFADLYSLKEVVLPSSIRVIGDYAFRYCRRLATINLNEGLEVIGAQAFSQNTSASNLVLTLTTLPNSVKTIGDYAFSTCNAVALTSLPSSLIGTIGAQTFQNTAVAISVIPEGVTAIGGSAFNCGAVASRQKITSITFPSTLTTLASNAFTSQANITYVEFKSSTPPTLSAQLVAGTAFPAAVTKIIVPQGALSAYQAATTSFSGFTFEEKVPTEMDKISSINVGIYPNPVSDRLNVVSAQGIKDVKIYNIAGRIVNVSQDATTKSFDVSHLAEGIYFLNVDGKVARFIKE